MIRNKKVIVPVYNKSKAEKYAEAKVIKIATKYIVQEQIIILQILKILGRVNTLILHKINN